MQIWALVLGFWTKEEQKLLIGIRFGSLGVFLEDLMSVKTKENHPSQIFEIMSVVE